MFAAEGARVAIVGRNTDRLRSAGEMLGQYGEGSVLAMTGDLSDPDVPAHLVSQVEAAMGSVDVLVNNVGLAYQTTFDEVTDQQWDELWQLNVMSYVRCIRAVLPAMRRRHGGCIVNVSSSAGKRPSIGMPNYSVTKAAVLSLSRLVADTYASDNVRSVAICPGPSLTPAWLSDGGLADQVAELKGKSREVVLEETGEARPLGRMAEPEEIAAMIVFAASSRASYLTGAALSIDGGSVPSIV